MKIIVSFFKKRRTVDIEFIFVCLATYYVLNVLIYTTLVLLSVFSIIPFFVLTILLFVLIIYFLIMNPVNINLTELTVLVILFYFGILSFIYFHPAFYGVRDEGVYANAAMGVINRGSIYIKDYINFPIWVKQGNVFIPPFMFGTIAWQALNYSLFDIKGLFMSNILPMIVGGMSYYYLAKPYLKKKSILLLFCFYLSYPMIWFTRRTLSEIIFFGILWFSFYLLRRIFVNKELHFITLLFITCCAGLLIRGEGMIYMSLMFLILLISNWKHKKKIIKYSLAGVLFLFPFLYYTFFVTNQYIQIIYKIFSRVLSKFFPTYFQYVQLNNVAESQILHIPGSLYYNVLPFVLAVFSNYNLLFFIFSILICLIYYIFKKEKNRNNVFLILLIVINLPTFYSFFDLTVAPDQPWFLRRYLFSVIPLAYFCGFIFVNSFLNSRSIKTIIMITFILINILVSAPILLFSDYKEMPKHIDNIASFFKPNDVIFVDQYSNDWYRIYDELYFRKKLNTFDVDASLSNNGDFFGDLRNNVNLNKYNNVYILTGDNSDINNLLNKNLVTVAYRYNINYTSIYFTSEFFHLPNIPMNNSLNLNYASLKPLITVPNTTYTESNKIIVYKVTSKKDFIKYYKFTE